MRFRFAALWHYCPRMLTLVVVAVVAAAIVVANLSEDVRMRPGAWMARSRGELKFDVSGPLGGPQWLGVCNVSYGWPLLWRQYVVTTGVSSGVLADLSSRGRLAGNVAMWLMMLGAPAVACEWLLRRYRLRLRWSLRAMLAAVGLIAAFCAWCVAAHDRANVEDQLITAIEAQPGSAWLERWGPAWLDVVGADRFRRRIIGVRLGNGDEKVEDLLERLAQRGNLQYLVIKVHCLSPRMASALATLRQLRTLYLAVDDPTPEIGAALAEALAHKPQLRTLCLSYLKSWNRGDDERLSHETLADIGKLTRLEALYLSDMAIDREDLACLGDLPNLRSLSLYRVSIYTDSDRPNFDAPLLSRLPALPRLETLVLDYSEVGDLDLRHLTMLPRLKSLRLTGTNVTDTGLSDLASLDSLEELMIGGAAVTAVGFESLHSLRHLKKLHIEGFGQMGFLDDEDSDGCLRALEALQQVKTGLVIDGGSHTLLGGVRSLDGGAESLIPPEYERSNRFPFREFVKLWMEQ